MGMELVNQLHKSLNKVQNLMWTKVLGPVFQNSDSVMIQ